MPVLAEPTMDARSDLASCRTLLRAGSRTFFAASLLLPERIRAPATALYAFCRLSDDAVDLGTASPTAAVAQLHERLAAIYASAPWPLPADRAFADTVARFDIPREMPEALIEGLAWDAAGRQYETLSDLNAYGARVAGAVGTMMTLVMGRRAQATLARACELGMAMQLSNIARDVGEDARVGRLYLPRQWMREAGLDPDAWLERPAFTPALGGVVARLLAAADDLYAGAAPGIADLPLSCRAAIRAARFLYAEIGHEVARNGHDSMSRRAVGPAARKVLVLARSFILVDDAAGPARSAAGDAADFLLRSVAPPRPVHRGGAVAWLVALFERLEKQDRLRHARMLEPDDGFRPRGRRLPGSPRPSRLRKLEC